MIFFQVELSRQVDGGRQLIGGSSQLLIPTLEPRFAGFT